MVHEIAKKVQNTEGYKNHKRLIIEPIVKRFFMLVIVSKPHDKCIKIEHVLIKILFKPLIIKFLLFGTTLLISFELRVLSHRPTQNP
jgi:hypothetical protein